MIDENRVGGGDGVWGGGWLWCVWGVWGGVGGLDELIDF